MGREKVELEVFRAGRMLQHGEDSSHCAPEVIGIKGHGHMDVVRVFITTLVTITKGWGFTKDGDVWGGTTDNAKANSKDGVEEEDGQEAEE